MEYRVTRRDILKALAVGLYGAVATDGTRAGVRLPAPVDGSIFFAGTYTKGRSEGIYRCRLDPASGSVRVEGDATSATNPSYLAIDAVRGRLFCVSEVSKFEGKPAGSVSAFSIDQETGGLRLVNSRSSGGEGPCYIAMGGGGRFVLVANYGGGSIAVLPVGVDGSLGEPSDVIQHAGSSVTARQQGPHPHSLVLDAQGRFAYAADLGLDKVLIYRFDGREGRLTPATPGWTDCKPGAGPRHLAFSPDGASFYVVNELDSTVALFVVDRSSGALEHRQTTSTLPGGVTAENYPADIHVSPNGRFLYCSNRGHDSIAVFALDKKTGEMKALQHESTQGKWPRGFVIDPTGRYLLVANQRSDSIRAFAIDQESGALRPTGYNVEIPMPVCLKFLC